MEEDDEEGAPSQGIGGVERGGLVDIFRQQVHPPAAAIAIGGLAVNMNVEGQRENFYGQTLQREGGAAESSAGGSVAAAAPMSLSPGAIEGLTFVSAAGSAQFTSAALARGGRDAQLQSKGKHGGNSLRLEASHCHQLSNPHVMTSYHKWAANQGTAKKASFWGFFEELKKAVGIYPPVWRCVGCHPSQDAALALYEQKKDQKIMPPGIVRYGGPAVPGHIKKSTDTKVFTNHLGAMSCKTKEYHPMLQAVIRKHGEAYPINEAYPIICMIQKCLLACPPSQSDCEELFSLLGLFQGMRATKVKVEHMEDRLYIHRNYCLQDLNGKTGLEHLTSLAEIKARPNLANITEYQKWVDEQSDLVDAIMGMYQLEKNSSSDVEDEEKEERMSTWVNSLTI